MSQIPLENPVSDKKNEDDRCATGLLVSIRSVREAMQLVGSGVDILDLKEPTRGPLGACDPQVWKECTELPAFPGAWSVALGEFEGAVERAMEVPEGIRYAKVGPSGIDNLRHLRELWGRVGSALSPTTELVGVGYADYVKAGSVEPEQVLKLATQFGLSTLLVDTYDKAGLGTVDELGNERLEFLCAAAKRAGIALVVAGKLQLTSLPAMKRWGVSRVGVRGAVCHQARTGDIDPALVEEWVRQVGNRGKAEIGD